MVEKSNTAQSTGTNGGQDQGISSLIPKVKDLLGCDVLERFTTIQSNIEAMRNSLDVIEGNLIDYCDTHTYGDICPRKNNLAPEDETYGGVY